MNLDATKKKKSKNKTSTKYDLENWFTEIVVF